MQRAIVERAQRGDHDAFAALAAASIARLDAAAQLILNDGELAREAVQETLMRAWRDLPTLRDPDRFEPWLRRLLVRSCLNEARRRRRHRIEVDLAVISEPVAPDVDSAALLHRDQLDRGFRRLSPEARTLIVLHHYLDLPLADVAAALGIPIGTAKSRLHRALQEMRAALDADTRVPLAATGEGHA